MHKLQSNEAAEKVNMTGDSSNTTSITVSSSNPNTASSTTSITASSSNPSTESSTTSNTASSTTSNTASSTTSITASSTTSITASNTTPKNDAWIKSQGRRYGGALEVKLDLHQPLDFQIVDMCVLDPTQIRSTNQAYDERLQQDTFYQENDRFHQSRVEGEYDDKQNVIHTRQCQVVMFGRTREGNSVAARVPFEPFIFIHHPAVYWNDRQQRSFNEFVGKVLNLNYQSRHFHTERVVRKRLYGWVPEKTQSGGYRTQEIPLLKVYLPNESKMRHLIQILYSKHIIADINHGREVKLSVWEGRVSTVHKFCDSTKVVPSGWVRINQYMKPKEYLSHAQIECLANIKQMAPLLQERAIAPILIASVDAEMYSGRILNSSLSANERPFPNSLCPLDKIICIGTSLWRYGSSQIDRYVFCLSDVNPDLVANATVFTFATEDELLKAWRDFITCQADPDCIIGYNICDFDWKYMALRADHRYQQTTTTSHAEADLADDDDEEKEIKVDSSDQKFNCYNDLPSEQSQEDPNNRFVISHTPTRFFRLARLIFAKTDLRIALFKSAAYGERKSYHLDMVGRFVLDLLTYVRRELKLASYKLSDVSLQVLLPKAVKIATKFKSWAEYTPEEKTQYESCKKIDMPPQQLFQSFDQGPDGRARIASYCATDCDLPIKIGQKMMVIPNLIEMSRVTYTSLPEIINRGQQIKVFNQLVLEAHRMGFVMNTQPLRKFDTYQGATVLDPEIGFHGSPVAVLDFASLYPSIIRAHNLCFSTLVTEAKYQNLPGVAYDVIEISGVNHYFVKTAIQKGVLPSLEENLLAARKQVKKEMKTCSPDIYYILDGKQLAIKVSCNSVYGFTGAQNGMYPCPEIAAAVTTIGRRMIEKSKQYIESHYDKLASPTDPQKLLPPTRVLYGDSVMPHTAVMIKYRDQLQILRIDTLYDTLTSQPVVESSEKAYACATPLDYAVWTEQGWTPLHYVMKHHVHKKLYRIITRRGIVEVTADHSLLDEQGQCLRPADIIPGVTRLLHYKPTTNYGIPRPRQQKFQHESTPAQDSAPEQKQSIMPDAQSSYEDMADFYYWGLETGLIHFESTNWTSLWQASRLQQGSFLSGFMTSLDTYPTKTLSWQFASQTELQSVIVTLDLLGHHNYSLNWNSTTQYYILTIYHSTLILPESLLHEHTVLHVEEIIQESGGYVYDLTTHNHHFHAGVGRLVVHNTDSVMIQFPVTSDEAGLKQAFIWAQEAAQSITQIFRTDTGSDAITLEFEKVYWPYLLLKKKGYGAIKFETPNIKAGQFDVKGLELVRRDWCVATQMFMDTTLRMLLMDRNVAGAQSYIKTMCQRMIDNELDINLFVMSKELKSQYKNPNTQLHLSVAKKIAARNAGAQPRTGDRVPFVICKCPHKVKFVAEQAEDPTYAVENKIPLDFLYYIQKQIAPPISRLFAPIMKRPEELFEDAIRQIQNEYNGFTRQGIRTFFADRGLIVTHTITTTLSLKPPESSQPTQDTQPPMSVSNSHTTPDTTTKTTTTTTTTKSPRSAWDAMMPSFNAPNIKRTRHNPTPVESSRRTKNPRVAAPTPTTTNAFELFKKNMF